jgi:hypothetical protein
LGASKLSAGSLNSPEHLCQELLELIRELDIVIDCIDISHLDPSTLRRAVFELHISGDQIDLVRIVWIEAPFGFTALNELVSELKDLFDR